MTSVTQAAEVLLRLDLTVASDVFALRQRARVVAAALGMEGQDQIRVATALSELGREVLGVGGAEVVFALDQDDGAIFVATLTTARPWSATADPGVGFGAAARLADELSAGPAGEGTTFRFVKRLRSPGMVTPKLLERVRAAVAATVPSTPLEELRAQNRELLGTLDALQAQQEQLVQLNAELEETNLGVVAMYHQLSRELEETNRGVVALYAELDQKAVEVQRATEAKTRFLNNVSHELRTPVNAIIGLVRLLEDPEPLAAPSGPEVGLIGQCAADLGRLVDELLDLAKAESGRLEPVLERVELPALLSSLVATLRPLISTPDVVLTLEAPEGLPVLETDKRMLTIVLRNLVTNALKFTVSGSVAIRATVHDSGHHITVTVTDTGIGIGPEDRDRIFEAFYQVRAPHHQAIVGTGLGLPYALRLSELLGGTLSLSSELGEGSTFRLELPVRYAAAPTFGALSPEAAGGHLVKTALVVDADPDFRQMLRGMLQDVAGRVIEAADGSEALTELRSRRPDVVFLDLRLPKVDGAAVLEALTADPALRDVPVLITCSVELDAAVLRAASAVARLLPKAGLDRVKVVEALAALLADSS